METNNKQYCNSNSDKDHGRKNNIKEWKVREIRATLDRTITKGLTDKLTVEQRITQTEEGSLQISGEEQFRQDLKRGTKVLALKKDYR